MCTIWWHRVVRLQTATNQPLSLHHSLSNDVEEATVRPLRSPFLFPLDWITQNNTYLWLNYYNSHCTFTLQIELYYLICYYFLNVTWSIITPCLVLTTDVQGNDQQSRGLQTESQWLHGWSHAGTWGSCYIGIPRIKFIPNVPAPTLMFPLVTQSDLIEIICIYN